jgi:hypothetical protein
MMGAGLEDRDALSRLVEARLVVTVHEEQLLEVRLADDVRT